MQIPARSPDWIRHLTTLLAGGIAAAAIWLIAGGPEIAWLGFVLAAVTAGPRGRRACRPRAAGWSRS
jgi:hypothetical protein